MTALKVLYVITVAAAMYMFGHWGVLLVLPAFFYGRRKETTP
jgi:hypothetical protein